VPGNRQYDFGKHVLAARLAVILVALLGPPEWAYAQNPASLGISSSNDLQRTYQMDRYTELADRGPARGETLYFYKCFVCHNHYARGGPPLAGLFDRAQSAGDGVVNDRTVTALIRNGTSAMPGFRYDMDGADMEDLVRYLKTASCCYEAANPPRNPQYLAATHKWLVPSALRGGVRGLVRGTNGKALAAVAVQLIAPNGVRTTVFSDEDGKYEFPSMQTGEYLLRVATPLSYRPYRRDGVWVNGDDRIGDIVLERVPQAAAGALPGALPATEWSASQLSGAELLWNLAGSMQDKTAFVRSCGIGCHDLNEVLRNRFNERSWRAIVGWMTSRGSGTAFVVRPARPTLSRDAERVIKWLSRVRGPASKDDPYRAFPRPPAGSSTNVVITEFELPRRFLSVHEVAGDSAGDIWYTSHRTPYVGMLDPLTGMVKEYRVPDIPGAFPGTYRVAVGHDGTVWLSQNWAHRLTRLDPATGEFKQILIDTGTPLNVGAWGNFALATDGYIWSELGKSAIVKMDAKSGRILKSYPLTRNPPPADNLISKDGQFWAGGAPTMGSNTGMILDIQSGKMYETNSGDLPSSSARGGFDRDDNAWFGGHTGSIIEIVNAIREGKGVHMRAFAPPTPYFPYSQFYSAVPDKRGEIWSAWVHGPGFVRFNPASDIWRVYDMPEPSAFARSTWVDDSTAPPTIWYPDYTLGILVRIQPRD
jgi:streptogramin lyase/mono/diheme cytochrome c family protein